MGIFRSCFFDVPSRLFFLIGYLRNDCALWGGDGTLLMIDLLELRCVYEFSLLVRYTTLLLGFGVSHVGGWLLRNWMMGGGMVGDPMDRIWMGV